MTHIKTSIMGSSISLPELKKPSFCRRKKASTQTSTGGQKISKHQISAPKSVDFRFSTFDHSRTIIIPSPRILLTSPDSPTESTTSSEGSSEPLLTSLKSTTHFPLPSISYSEKTIIPVSTKPSSLRRAAPAISWSSPIASPPPARTRRRTTTTKISSPYHHQHPLTSTTTARSSRTLLASPTTTTTPTARSPATRYSRTLIPSPALSTIPESEPRTSTSLTISPTISPTTSPTALATSSLTSPTPPATALTTQNHKPYCNSHAQTHPPYLSCEEARRETRRRIDESILRRESIRRESMKREGIREKNAESRVGPDWNVFRQHRIRLEDEGGWWF
ncbi:MAG: hypothetical protein L6R37_004034 [Teloschistes peruensis]|nr:MAG: hypothetical protein L6R37_004034 [Teloschistes peruensis]